MPDFPFELDYVWTAFNQAAATRQTGMGVNPLTYLELEAYERKALNRLPAWETALIMRLDRTVRAQLAAEEKNDKVEADTEVSVNDRGGVRGLLSNIGARFRAKK